jgi:hypothetical protein
MGWVMMKKELKLCLLQDKFCYSKLPQFAELPSVFAKGEMCFVMRTDEELTIVSPEFMAPNNVQQEIGFRGLRVASEVSFTEVGVIASLTQPLQDAGVSVMVVSTFNTEYLFFREEDLAKVTNVLQDAGHEFISEE